jgi:hypothetical protein
MSQKKQDDINDLEISSSISSAIIFMIVMLVINEFVLGFLQKLK